MATYTLEHPDKGLISYTDKKRYLWLISMLMPAFPLMGVAIFSDWHSVDSDPASGGELPDSALCRSFRRQRCQQSPGRAGASDRG